MAVISSLLIRLSVAHRGVERGFDKAREHVDKFERKVNQSSAALNRMGRAMTSIGVGPGLVAAIGGITSLASVAAPAANTILTLPAAIAQFAAAGTVLKLAGANMSDAITAVAEGADDAKEKLSKLPPSARLVAQTVGEMKRRLTVAVQDRLFAPWAKEFSALSRDQGPMLERSMGGVADALGRVARQAVRTANTPLVSGVIKETFLETARSVDALGSATPSLIRGLAAVVKVGNPFITTFVRSATAAAAAKAEWLASADGMAWLERKLDQGRDTTRKLLEVVGNLGSTLLSILGQSRISSGALLDKIVALTDRMAEWAKSVEGQKKIAEFMERARKLGTQIWEALGRVVDVALKLADAFNRLPAPVQDALLTFSAYSLVLGPLITRFASLIAIVIQLSTALITGSLSAVTFATTHVASAARTAAAWIALRASLLSIWIQLQAMAIASAARTAAAWVASYVAQAAAATVNMARVVATTVGAWVLMATQSLIQAARMAGAWLIAMGPIGLVIAVVAALVYMIIKNWDTIVEWTKKAWNWVYTKGIKPAVDLVIAYVRFWVNTVNSVISFFGQLPGKLWGWFKAGYDAVVSQLGALLNWIRGLPGRIWEALGDMGARAAQWGRDIIQGIINGIGDMVGRLVQKARDAATSAMNAIKGALGIGSPSKITYKYAIWVGEGAVNGLDKMVAPTTRAAERLADSATRPWKALGRTAPYTVDQGVRVQMSPTAPPPSDDDDRRPGGDYPGDGRGPLVSIGTFNAGGQTPEQTARALDWRMRTGR